MTRINKGGLARVYGPAAADQYLDITGTANGDFTAEVWWGDANGRTFQIPNGDMNGVQSGPAGTHSDTLEVFVFQDDYLWVEVHGSSSAPYVEFAVS